MPHFDSLVVGLVGHLYFREAMESNELKAKNLVDIQAINVPDSYAGPKIQENGLVMEKFVSALIEDFGSRKSLEAHQFYRYLWGAQVIMRIRQSAY